MTAEDILAETFSEAWLRSARFRDERDGSARPWLFGIARNLVADYHRHQRVVTRARRRLAVDLERTDDETDALVDRLDAERSAGSLGEAVASLPPEQREAVELRAVGELPFNEIGEAMGSSPDLARVRVMRGLRRLRDRLGRDP